MPDYASLRKAQAEFKALPPPSQFGLLQYARVKGIERIQANVDILEQMDHLDQTIYGPQAHSAPGLGPWPYVTGIPRGSYRR